MTRRPAIKPENIQVTYSRSLNLRDMLVKAEVSNQSLPTLSQPCWQPRCLTCPHMNTSQVISNQANHSYPTRGNFVFHHHCGQKTCQKQKIKTGRIMDNSTLTHYPLKDSMVDGTPKWNTHKSKAVHLGSTFQIRNNKIPNLNGNDTF